MDFDVMEDKRRIVRLGFCDSPSQPCHGKEVAVLFHTLLFYGSPITAPFEHSLSRTPVYDLCGRV